MKVVPLVFSALLLASPLIAHADAGPQGPAILAKTSGDAVIMWQATPEVIDIVKNHVDNTTALNRLELDAVRVAQKLHPRLNRAKTVSVRIMYEKVGAVSPQYGAATFGGFEPLATLKISSKALHAYSGWDKALADAHLPAGMTVTVTGAFPAQ